MMNKKKLNSIKQMFLKTSVSMLFFCITSSSLASNAVLLVSLGMPDAVLKAYLKQGKQYHIPIVIRGLYSEKAHLASNPIIGNFKDTAERVKALTQDNKMGGVSINPLLFRAFNVKTVPAFIVYDDHLSCLESVNKTPYQSCQPDTFDVQFGNLPLPKLLSHVADQSDDASRAASCKARLKAYQSAGESA